MPYACALFAETMNDSMRTTANTIASSSAFVPAVQPFHVPLFGSLHSYAAEEVAAALAAVPEGLRGRFLRWDLRNSLLRVLVELSQPDALLHHFQQALPRGKAWRELYVTVGSVAKIDKHQHEAFLAAVVEAFPIDESLAFDVARLHLHNAHPPPEDKDKTGGGGGGKRAAATSSTGKASLNPNAKSFEPMKKQLQMPGAIQKKSKNKKRSPHKTWVRTVSVDPPSKAAARTERASTNNKALALSSIDDLIKKSQKGDRAKAETERQV